MADAPRDPGPDDAQLPVGPAAFLAFMAHEIRTPMTAILGFAEMLTESPGLDEERRALVHAIRRNGEHLLKLVNDVLDMSRMEAGGMMLEELAVSPAAIAQEVVASLHPKAQAGGLELSCQLAGPIPALIRTDPTRFRQILLNLVGNAIKFTPAGSVRVRLECPEGRVPPVLQVHVEDSGIGIRPEQISRIFRPFAQGDRTTVRRFGGTGLGLTISRRLARMLGGDVSVRSEPGRGSTFTVEVATGPLDGVPMVQALPAPQLPGAPRESDSNGSPRGRVLVAEDGPDNQRLLSAHLTRAGYEVTLAENGRVAEELALASLREGAPFDVILMDMEMPEVDGCQAAQHLRGAGYRQPIVALTAHTSADDRRQCLAAGCDEVLTKPIDRLALLEAVSRHRGLGAKKI